MLESLRGQAGRHPQQTEHFLSPEHFLALAVDFPAADMRRTLGLSQQQCLAGGIGQIAHCDHHAMRGRAGLAARVVVNINKTPAQRRIMHPALKMLRLTGQRLAQPRLHQFVKHIRAEHVRHRAYSDWMRQHAPDFALVESLAQPFPLLPGSDRRTTSFAAFKLFERMVGGPT